MKIRWASFILGLCASLSLIAQVSVEVEFEKNQFVSDEEMRVAVHITNLSGQVLRLGADSEWLTFDCESVERGGLAALDPVPVEGEFELANSKRGTKRLEMSRSYDFSTPGRYFLKATLKIPGWEEVIESKPAYFEVISGIVVWEQVVGVPKSPQTASTQRRFVLQKATFLKEIRLYFRLADPDDTKTYKVYNLGPIPSFGEVDALVDHRSRLHVLHQFGPRFFSYTIFNTEGELELRNRYEGQSGRPRLGLDPEGDVQVRGGRLRPSTTDFPRETSALNNEGPERN